MGLKLFWAETVFYLELAHKANLERLFGGAIKPEEYSIQKFGSKQLLPRRIWFVWTKKVPSYSLGSRIPVVSDIALGHRPGADSYEKT